jgi:hypothetical protein
MDAIVRKIPIKTTRELRAFLVEQMEAVARLHNIVRKFDGLKGAAKRARRGEAA